MESRKISRLLVACLVLLTVTKLFSSNQRKNNMQVMTSETFWDAQPAAGLSSNLLVPQSPTYNREKPEEHNLVRHIKLEVKNMVKKTVKRHKGTLRVVHLDLKGAAPKVSYFQQLFPLISNLGADGILVEYEDMFPYEGDLEILRSPFAYSAKDIEEIKRLASLNNLELIPLVQVFGHLEFVLKHEQFFDLREVSDFPNSLNPLVPGSIKLIKAMLTQVLKKHPQARWFHIGADEVYGLGEGKDLKQNYGSVDELFLLHLRIVCQFLSKMRPGIKPIFWEDMLRKINVTLIRASGMSSLASPMIWNYNSNMQLTEIGRLLSNYQQAGFQNVWFASAFKGSSGISQRWTPLNYHLQNHLAWLQVMNLMSEYPTLKLDGIALTGWQRYAHHTVLCELLPVAIPSLATCLKTLKYGSFNHTTMIEIQRFLGCEVDLQTDSCLGHGTFPGSRIFYMIQKIHNELQKSVDGITENYYLKGSFGPYQRKYNFANPWYIELFKDALTETLNEWDRFMEEFKMEMMSIYFPDTVEEWMEENVNQYMDTLHGLAKDVEHIGKRKGKPKSLKPVRLINILKNYV